MMYTRDPSTVGMQTAMPCCPDSLISSRSISLVFINSGAQCFCSAHVTVQFRQQLFFVLPSYYLYSDLFWQTDRPVALVLRTCLIVHMCVPVKASKRLVMVLSRSGGRSPTSLAQKLPEQIIGLTGRPTPASRPCYTCKSSTSTCDHGCTGPADQTKAPSKAWYASYEVRGSHWWIIDPSPPNRIQILYVDDSGRVK